MLENNVPHRLSGAVLWVAVLAVVGIGVLTVGPVEAGRTTIPPPPPSSECSQEYDGGHGGWQDPVPEPGTDVRNCRDMRDPVAQSGPNGELLRTPDGRVRMFLMGQPPPRPVPGSPELAARDAAQAFLTRVPARDAVSLARAEAAANLPPEVAAYLPAADPLESLQRALRSGAAIEVEPLPRGMDTPPPKPTVR
jgi:hypothetical protein